jgi:hypothetical protein
VEVEARAAFIERFRRNVQIGLLLNGGTCSVQRPDPLGDYYAAAVTALNPGEWRDPELLEALVPRATHLTVSEGDNVTAELRVVTR